MRMQANHDQKASTIPVSQPAKPLAALRLGFWCSVPTSLARVGVVLIKDYCTKCDSNDNNDDTRKYACFYFLQNEMLKLFTE